MIVKTVAPFALLAFVSLLDHWSRAGRGGSVYPGRLGDEQQRSHSCLHNILPRTAKQNATMLIRVSFKDGHHKDKTFEVFKPENARDCVIGILRPSKTATDRITRYLCDGRVVLAGRQHANCILDNRPPSPGSCPVSKHVSSFDAVFQPGNETFLSLRQIGCQQERKQMHTIHVFCEHSAKLDARCVPLRCLSRDRRSSWHGQLCPLCSPLPISVNQVSASRAQCLNILLRTSGQNSFATLKKVSRAICCPHLFAVFPNDRFTAG